MPLNLPPKSKAARSQKVPFLVPGSWFLVPSQQGAMFGLDARIALAIFGILSIVAGTALVLSLNSIRAKSLATELTETGRAVESLIGDLGTDIFPSLEQPSEKNAFTALFDGSVIKETDNLRSKWLGPYIKYTSSRHPRYGDMLLQPHALKHTENCSPDGDCYLWLVYSNVPHDISQELNTLLDSEHETDAATTGRLQWTNDQSADVLYFRASKTLTPQTTD